MNMPEDMREIITAALQDVQAWADTLGYKPEDVALAIMALAWLDAQPAMPEPRWEPVEPTAEHPIFDTNGRCLYFLGGRMAIEENYTGNYELIKLPPDVRICRRIDPDEGESE